MKPKVHENTTSIFFTLSCAIIMQIFSIIFYVNHEKIAHPRGRKLRRGLFKGGTQGGFREGAEIKRVLIEYKELHMAVMEFQVQRYKIRKIFA